VTFGGRLPVESFSITAKNELGIRRKGRGKQNMSGEVWEFSAVDKRFILKRSFVRKQKNVNNKMHCGGNAWILSARNRKLQSKKKRSAGKNIKNCI